MPNVSPRRDAEHAHPLRVRAWHPTWGRQECLLFTYDPIPWLIAQEGEVALRARRRLGLAREGDDRAATALANGLAKSQRGDGSFESSPMKTAGVLNLLPDLRIGAAAGTVAAAAEYLVSVLQSQPGYEQGHKVKPGTLTSPCDLGGFFGPYEDRGRPDVLQAGAREMNFYRKHEPLLGPGSPVRSAARSGRDRPGPASCYAWGLIPLCYTVEALCRAGLSTDARLRPAVNVLLGAQRKSGGWCRNLAGHPNCSLHALRALAAHGRLRQSSHAEKALAFLLATARPTSGRSAGWWRGSKLFAAIETIAAFDSPLAREALRYALGAAARHQRRNGSFGNPCAVQRVAAVLLAGGSIAPNGA